MSHCWERATPVALMPIKHPMSATGVARSQPSRDDAGHLPNVVGEALDHCMNQPWLTTIDWPLNAVLPAAAK